MFIVHLPERVQAFLFLLSRQGYKCLTGMRGLARVTCPTDVWKHEIDNKKLNDFWWPSW